MVKNWSVKDRVGAIAAPSQLNAYSWCGSLDCTLSQSSESKSLWVIP